MENRLKEIAGNLKRDVRDLLDESANIVTGLFKQGLCTANGMTTRWNAFTHGLSQAAKELFRLRAGEYLRGASRWNPYDAV